MSEKITKETIRALRDGDHGAFDALFFEYYGRIKYFIGGLVRSESDAEELTQDIFVKLWSNRGSLDPEKSVSSFMYTMARNSSLNFLKHKFVRDSYVHNYRTEDAFESSEEILFAKETMLLVDMAVASMPEQRRKIYVMSRQKGLSNDEISQLLNISKKTVENQMSLALKEIRRVIAMFVMFFS